MGELSMLPNIGKEVESQLNRVGIKTLKESELPKNIKEELKEFYNYINNK
jgi:DNA transformation protein